MFAPTIVLSTSRPTVGYFTTARSVQTRFGYCCLVFTMAFDAAQLARRVRRRDLFYLKEKATGPALVAIGNFAILMSWFPLVAVGICPNVMTVSLMITRLFPWEPKGFGESPCSLFDAARFFRITIWNGVRPNRSLRLSGQWNSVAWRVTIVCPDGK